MKNGQLKIYEHQDWDINGNDIVGYVIPGDSTMISVNNWTASEDDLERDNHYVDTKKDYTGDLHEALYKDGVNSEISSLKEENESLREKDRELEDQIQALTDRISSIERQVLSFQTSISSLEAQAGDMKQDIDNLQAKVDYLLSEQTVLLQRIATLETGVQATKESLQDLEKLVTEIQLKCEQVEKELGQLQRKYDLGAPVIDSLRQEKIDQFNTEIVKLENDIKAGDNSKQELQARLDEIKKLVPLIGM